jgi:hypothetical protein
LRQGWRDAQVSVKVARQEGGNGLFQEGDTTNDRLFLSRPNRSRRRSNLVLPCVHWQIGRQQRTSF